MYDACLMKLKKLIALSTCGSKAIIEKCDKSSLERNGL